MDSTVLLRTGLVALLFALIFGTGGPLRPLYRRLQDRGSVISFAAGMSAAYVFVHVMPELHGAREALAEGRDLVWEGMSTYFVALMGFLLFYALGQHRHEHHVTGSSASEREETKRYRLQLWGFALYVWLIGYLLVRSFEHSGTADVLFAVAMAGHMLSINNSLRTEYREPYLRAGRFVLAAAAPLGWLFGLLWGFPEPVTALLLAFVSGGVIVNSAVTELSKDAPGHLRWFVAGGLLYGLILLPLG